ncbi:GNAT family N-acetyltransferase [Halomarina oriensis]|uniref:GNAT family N-acetyltransferase n=2 Tax=Halomarina oriensis TaxID=671145 RepID=A0A6B0GRX2_9EURY|nr:GNAT family N-acetyltransferase [Halomarina oriensis]MWG34418.1 GNAT family N-acetyltransferase [Halomarina oriensis]
MRVLEGALLEVDAATVRERIERGAVWVAVVGEREDSSERVVGALLLDTPDREGVAPRPEEVRPDRRHVEAVAVTHQRRGRGIGRALVEGCVEETGCDRLTAEFRAEVEPFYEALGFDVDELDEGRRWGELRVGR